MTKKIEGIKCASLAKRKRFFKNKTRQSVWALDYKMTLKEKIKKISEEASVRKRQLIQELKL